MSTIVNPYRDRGPLLQSAADAYDEGYKRGCSYAEQAVEKAFLELTQIREALSIVNVRLLSVMQPDRTGNIPSTTSAIDALPTKE